MRLITTSIIDGEFNGYNEGMVFRLGNGEIWMQDEYHYDYSYSYRPEVKILTDNSRCYLQVEDMEDSVSVRKLNNCIESTIVGDFSGWDGDTTFTLDNEQVWKQSQYSYVYHYAYRPKVLIYDDGYTYKLSVVGVAEHIPVVRIK